MQSLMIAAALLVNCAAGEKWYFRGTPNNWGANEIRKYVNPEDSNDPRFCHTEQFAGNGDGFKISSGNKHDWTGDETYPQNNWVIYQGAGVYSICFNSETKEIEVRKFRNPLGPWLVLTHNGNKVTLPMTLVGTKYGRVVVETYMRTEYVQAGTEIEAYGTNSPNAPFREFSTSRKTVVTEAGHYAFSVLHWDKSWSKAVEFERV